MAISDFLLKYKPAKAASPFKRENDLNFQSLTPPVTKTNPSDFIKKEIASPFFQVKGKEKAEPFGGELAKLQPSRFISAFPPQIKEIEPRVKAVKQDFRDVANMFAEISAGFASIAVNPALSFVEALKKKPLGSIEIPLFKKQQIKFQGVQSDYEERLKSGQSADKAFWGSAISFGIDLTFLVGLSKAPIKNTLMRKNPEALINRTAIETKKVRDYISGRANYEGIEVSQTLKDVWGGLSSIKKKEVLKGMIEIDEIMPSRLGKILGITQKQAETLAKQSGLRIISETRMLPGRVVEPQPAFGLSIRREREVGKTISSISKAKASGQSFDEWADSVIKNKDKIPTTPEYLKYLKENDAFVKREIEIYAEMKAMRDKYSRKIIKDVPLKDIAKYDGLQKELNQTLSKKTLAKSPEGVIKTHIGDKALKEQLKAEWDRVGREIKSRQMKTSAEIPSLEKMAKEFIPKEKLPTTIIKAKAQEIQKVSYNKDIAEETKLVKRAQEEVAKKDFTKTIEDVREIKKEPDTITTRKFKQTDEWKSFAKYAEENLQNKDIRPAMLFRHITMTAERVAEFLDGGLGGRTYRTMVKPVYDSAKKMTIEGNQIKQEFDNFRILEGTKLDRDASLFGQKKLTDAPQKAKEATEYVRNKYDEFLTRLNEIRAKIGIEPIPKRQDYITHINELNTLSELFGGMERISVKKHISQLKSELLDLHPDWTEARAFDAAKRKVEGLTGIGQYVDARQPIFKFAKQRLSEYEANPSITRSFNAYVSSALRYIHQAENVAKNKAFKDVLPANAREFMRLWNTEQVAGRQPPSFLSPVAKRAVSALRGTL